MTISATEVFKTSGETGKRMHAYTIAFDDAYVTGGEPLTPGQVGLTRIDAGFIQSTDGYVFTWDQANQKILAYYGDNNNAADGKLIEVPDTTDINANLTLIQAIFFGV